MPALQCACPKCQQPLQVAQALPARVQCPRCQTAFVVKGPAKLDKAGLIQKDRDAVRGIKPAGNGIQPAGKTPVRTFNGPTPLVIPSAAMSAARRKSSGAGLLIFLSCLFLLLLAAAVVVVWLMNRGEKTSLAELPPPAEAPPAPFVPVMSERDLKIQDAIQKGVAYLRNQILNPTGKSYYFNDKGAGSNVGVLALAGLTLLECGVASNDPAVEKVVEAVRREAPRLRFTYSVALCVLFLDRFNHCTDRTLDPAFVELERKLALQLMAAQNTKGGWDYYSAVLTQPQYESLLADLKANRFRPGTLEGDRDDNSINQFATLALWAARRQGIKTEPALALVEKRYLQNQNDDGSWGYHARDDGPLKDSTTCAGLIGLAVGQGIRSDPASKNGNDPTKFGPIAHGLDYIARTGKNGQPEAVGKDPRRMGPEMRATRLKHTADMMELNRQWQEGPESERKSVEDRINAIDKAKLFRGTYFNTDSWGDLYFLWSVERVAVIFGLNKIGGHDWYNWGVDVILPNQMEDGSWRDRFPGVPDTCFALLFLKRANIVKDLSDKFRVVASGPAIGALPQNNGQMPQPGPARKE